MLRLWIGLIKSQGLGMNSFHMKAFEKDNESEGFEC